MPFPKSFALTFNIFKCFKIDVINNNYQVKYLVHMNHKKPK